MLQINIDGYKPVCHSEHVLSNNEENSRKVANMYSNHHIIREVSTIWIIQLQQEQLHKAISTSKFASLFNTQ